MSYFQKKSKKPFSAPKVEKKVEAPKVKCKFHKEHKRHCVDCEK